MFENKNDKLINFQYKNTDFEEGDKVTYYIQDQLRKKYPGGIPEKISPKIKLKIPKKKLYQIPENIKDIIRKLK